MTPDNKPTYLTQEPISEAKSTISKASEVITNGASDVSSAAPSYNDLKSQLAEAQTKIASFSQDGGLRLRKNGGGESESAPGATTEVAQNVQTTEGVPIQIVAALCLISFLLAYLFF